MLISKVNGINFKADDKKKVTPKKAIAATVGVTAVGASLYLAGKHHLLGDRIYQFLNKSTPVVPSSTDKLTYQIQAPKYDTSIVLAPDETGYRIYQSILENMEADKNTSQRLSEVTKTMTEDLSAILDKVSEIRNEEKVTLNPNNKMFDLDIAKKRFYSIPANSQKGYSCLDPLTHQKAREEIVDLNLGYRALEELNTSSKSELLDSLLSAYSDKISDKDRAFISDCTKKLSPQDARCYGKASVLHSRELSDVGRIFRTAMGLNVR